MCEKCMHMYVYVHVEVGNQSWVLFFRSHPSSLLFGLELPRLAGQWAPAIRLAPPLQRWHCKCVPPSLAIFSTSYVGSRNLNSGSHACMANTVFIKHIDRISFFSADGKSPCLNFLDWAILPALGSDFFMTIFFLIGFRQGTYDASISTCKLDSDYLFSWACKSSGKIWETKAKRQLTQSRDTDKDWNCVSMHLCCVTFLQLSAQLLESELKFKGEALHEHFLSFKKCSGTWDSNTFMHARSTDEF